jgi:uracil-DNA glycosylase
MGRFVARVCPEQRVSKIPPIPRPEEVCGARQEGAREEREAVRGTEGEGHVQGKGGSDREFARRLKSRRQEISLVFVAFEFLARRNDSSEESGRPQGRQGDSAEELSGVSPQHVKQERISGFGSRPSLARARADAASCRRCDLWRHAKQVVFGEGRSDARLMIVGEQPGDVEDRAGRPFVGPAGRLLRELLAESGLDERDLYLTNAVKHFKFEQRGPRRIHDTPGWIEIRACDHWLRIEIAAVRPALLICLGATATRALLGKEARVTKLRGRVLEETEFAFPIVVTIHPSAVLRGGERREELRRQLQEDLALAATTIKAMQ